MISGDLVISKYINKLLIRMANVLNVDSDDDSDSDHDSDYDEMPALCESPVYVWMWAVRCS